jgi:hypothetical protein
MEITEDTTVGEILSGTRFSLEELKDILFGEAIDTEGELVREGPEAIDTMGLGIIPGGKMNALALDFSRKLRKL